MVQAVRSHREMLEWQYKTLLGELQQIELHVSSGDCPCILKGLDPAEYCLAKHTLNVATLASETAAMDPPQAKLLKKLNDEAQDKHDKVKAFVCHKGKLPELAEWARGYRKLLEPVYYACRTAHMRFEPENTAEPLVLFHAPKASRPETEIRISGKCEGTADSCKLRVRKVHQAVKIDSLEALPDALDKVARMEQPSSSMVRISGQCTGSKAETCTIKVKATQSVETLSSVAETPDAVAQVVTEMEKAQKPAAISAVTWAIGPKSQRWYEFKHRLLEADRIIASHDPVTFEPVPGYPPELQPRMRARYANRVQVQDIAAHMTPMSLLSDFHSLDRGIPIVGPDKAVESGNGRIMGIKLAIQEFPAVYAEYKAELLRQAATLGLDPAAAQAMVYPIVVRERVTDVPRREFVEEANAPTTLAPSSIEVARADAMKITSDMMGMIVVGDDQSIEEALRGPANGPFISTFLALLTPNEIGQLADKYGRLNQDGVRRLALALFVAAFPGDNGLRLAEKFFESTEPTVRNVANGIAQSLGKLARAESLCRQGNRDPDLAISEDLAAAAVVFATIKGTPGMSVDKYVNQSQMFDRQLTSFQEMLLRVIGERSRSAKKIGSLLRAYAEIVMESPPPQQTAFLPTAKLTKAEALDRAIRRGDSSEQAGLFQQEVEAWQLTPDAYLHNLAEQRAIRFGYVPGSAEFTSFVTRSKRRGRFEKMNHRYIVAKAFEAGKPIPARVLAFYPDLTQRLVKPSTEQITIGPRTYTWSTEVRRIMDQMAEQTGRDKHEHGFDICEKDGVAIPGQHCKGGKCSIATHDCTGLTRIGHYHTHPSFYGGGGDTGVTPSAGDIITTPSGEFACIGNPYTDKIQCMQWKGLQRQPVSCPKRHAWAWIPDDATPNIRSMLASGTRILCNGIKDKFDRTFLDRKTPSITPMATVKPPVAPLVPPKPPVLPIPPPFGIQPVQGRMFQAAAHPEWCTALTKADSELQKAEKSLASYKTAIAKYHDRLRMPMQTCAGQKSMF